jgi:hypothetical protein
MMKIQYYLFILLLLFTACSSNKDLTKQDKVSLPYNIVVGQGGGFTGGHTGYYIDTLGLVKSFSGVSFARSKMENIGQLSSSQINEINSSFQAIMNIKYNKVGNMTSYIVIAKYNYELRFSWEGTSPDQNVPPELVTFYQKVNNAINNSRK